MVTSKKMKLAFSSNIPRFGKQYAHPNYDPTGLLVTRPEACDPCRYHPKPMSEAYAAINKRNKKDTKEPWKYKSDLEDWCKNLGYRNQKILEQRRWYAGLLGPAWTEVPEPTKYEPACKNVLFGRVARFKPPRSSTPGPGTYYQAVPYKAPYGPHSTRNTMDREEPCRFKDTAPVWSLAPDRYRIRDHGAIENKSKKIVSLRGPYDLFTGKRDMSTIKNHFSGVPEASKTWPLSLPGSFEGLKKKHTGVWNKTNRDVPPRNRVAMTNLEMIPRKPNEPSPATYNVVKPREFVQYRYAFNSSYDRPPGYQRTIVWPGVGRYNVAKDRPCGIEGQGHKHVFLSKIQRTIGAIIPEPLYSF